MILIDTLKPKSCEECFYRSHCDGYHIEILKDDEGDWMPFYIAHSCPLIDLGEQQMSTWISCSERLPNEKERIASYIHDKRASEFIVMIKGVNRPTTLYISWDNYWFDENREFYEVIAWMPLPEAWKGADDE